nr:hypothetical protein [Lachnospiraceae bacterium]
MKERNVFTRIMLSAFVLLQVMVLGGCSMGHSDVPETEAPVIEIEKASEPASVTEQSDPVTTEEVSEPEEEAGAKRQDGERFEGIIMMEGMEEPVRFEHIRDDEIGFEMDYDYESLKRVTEPGKESFVSIYDDPDNPENCLEVAYREESPDTVEASIDEELSGAYDKTREEYTLDNAGSCIRIATSLLREKDNIPYYLQTVYIIPAGSGSIVARDYCTLESVEGFGTRFAYMINTLSVIDRSTE